MGRRASSHADAERTPTTRPPATPVPTAATRPTPKPVPTLTGVPVESPFSKVNVGTASAVAIYPDIGAAHELRINAGLEVTVHLVAPGVHI